MSMAARARGWFTADSELTMARKEAAHWRRLAVYRRATAAR